MRVGDEPKDGGVRKRRLVEGLETVDEEDDGQDAEVDLAEDTSIVARRDDDASLVGLLEELRGLVSARERDVGVGLGDRGNVACGRLGVSLAVVCLEMDDIRIVFWSSHVDNLSQQKKRDYKKVAM